MPQANFSVRWGGAIIPALLLVALGARATTPAGTELTVCAELTYTDDTPRVVYAEPVTVTVGRKAAASVTLASDSGEVSAMSAIPCTITNRSNYAATLRATVTKTANTSAILVRDDNNDGEWQITENTPMRATDELAPGTAASAFLLVTPRPGVIEGETGSVTVFAAPEDKPDCQGYAWFRARYSAAHIRPAFQFQAPTPFSSSPTVRHGLALAGTEAGVLYAVHVAGERAGSLAWRYPAQGGLGAAIRSRAAADNTGIYICADDGSVHKVSLGGIPIWQRRLTNSPVSMTAMPIVQNDDLFVACGDGRVRRLDPDTGEVYGTSPPLGGGALSTPTAPGQGDLWIGGADGRLYDIKANMGFTVFSARQISGRELRASPFMDISSGLVIVANAEGEVYALQAYSSRVIWGPVPLGGQMTSSPYVDIRSGVAWFSTDNGSLHALRMEDGSPVEGYPVAVSGAGGAVGSPVVSPLADGRATAFVAAEGGSFHALNAEFPALHATFDAGEANGTWVGSPALSGPGENDVVVACSTSGALYGFAVRDAVVAP